MRRRRPMSKARHRQRQMLILIQVSLMVGILLIVVFFRDNFSVMTSSFVSGFDAEDVQVNQAPAETPPSHDTPPHSQSPLTPAVPEGQRLPPLE